ncbi:MAG: outer membrane lipoprotein-sorting protein [Deltaproteobacteria bacterium]|nr:outer membrane lipoprotein-sorting protein [Deltaproteobacteria bacterium]MBT6501532.1 outer membrane lipoprotein-sorting protein [Deltaproteobacteria bacterium]MBT7889570.1 outer membrane lipoprotein-sorting protein [Deltaproteobacteria bacterium]
MKTKLITLLVALLFLMGGLSLPVAGQTARDIMLKVEKVTQESSTSAIQKMKLSTCKYGKKKKKIVCIEKPRVKVIESIQKDMGPSGKDTYGVSIILEPIGEKGIGMLSYDYDAADKDADTWLYLSALGKVKRMISSSEDSDESGSFFGTEFSVEDMESSKIDDYKYKMIKQTSYRKRPVWIVESVPTPQRMRKTRYGKVVTWVDRERFIVLKVHLYNRHGKPHKRLSMRDIKLIDNVWVARKMSMNNLISRRVTHMRLYAIAFNIDVPDAFLTQRTLTDFAFRERELGKLRKHIK